MRIHEYGLYTDVRFTYLDLDEVQDVNLPGHLSDYEIKNYFVNHQKKYNINFITSIGRWHRKHDCGLGTPAPVSW